VFAYLNGRSSRGEYWIGIALLLLVGVGLALANISGASAATTFLWIMIWARRLHDIGKSGWVILVPMGLMIAVSIAAFALGGDELVNAVRDTQTGSGQISERGAWLFLAFVGVVLLIQGGFTIWLGVKTGEPVSNRFGPPPGKLFG
jgi:uncharacterized membrane protein YhaH (DUF805 family)